VSSKTISTTSGGYGVDNISVAVLINRASLVAALGGKPTPEAIEKQLSEVEQLVASAAGAHKERGDAIKIAAVDFVDAGHELEPQPPPPVTEMLVRQSGNVLNAVTILVVTLLLIWFGLRPAARAIFSAPALVSAPAEIASLDGLTGAFAGEEARPQLGAWDQQSEVSLIEDLTSNPRRSPQKRLEQIVEYDEEQAAAILRQWMRQGDYA
jgi:flagellar M-ring protein FliF